MTDHTEGLPEPAAAYMRGCNQEIAAGTPLYTADQLRAYGEACAKAARAEAASWEKQASDRLDDALRFAREADAWKAKAMAARAQVIEAAIDLVAFHGGSVEIEAAIRALSSKEAEHG